MQHKLYPSFGLAHRQPNPKPRLIFFLPTQSVASLLSTTPSMPVLQSPNAAAPASPWSASGSVAWFRRRPPRPFLHRLSALRPPSPLRLYTILPALFSSNLLPPLSCSSFSLLRPLLLSSSPPLPPPFPPVARPLGFPSVTSSPTVAQHAPPSRCPPPLGRTVFFGESTSKSSDRSEIFQARAVGKMMEKVGVKEGISDPYLCGSRSFLSFCYLGVYWVVVVRHRVEVVSGVWSQRGRR